MASRGVVPPTKPREETPRRRELFEWDTAFWGLPVARVREDRLDADRLRQIDAQCRDEDVACRFVLARADDALRGHMRRRESRRLLAMSRSALNQRPR